MSDTIQLQVGELEKIQQDQAKFTLDYLQEKESENKQKKEEYMRR